MDSSSAVFAVSTLLARRGVGNLPKLQPVIRLMRQNCKRDEPVEFSEEVCVRCPADQPICLACGKKNY